MKHGREYFSPSQLKKLFLSVGQLNAYLKRAFTTSSAMALGSAVHCRLLEPLSFDDRYIVFDDAEKCKEIGGKRPTATKAYSEFKLEFAEQNKDKDILTQSDWEIIEKIESNCAMNGIIDTFFTDGDAEITVRGVAKGFDEEFEALCIIDYDKEDMSIDLKTTSKPLHKFRFDANELGYDIQAVVTQSLNQKDFVFIAVQTVEPYDIGVYTISESFKNRGKMKVNQALTNYSSYEDIYSSAVLTFEL